MKCFDADTKKKSVPSFSTFIKLIKVQCTLAGSWVSPLTAGQNLPPCNHIILTADIEMRGGRFAVMNQANQRLPSLDMQA